MCMHSPFLAHINNHLLGQTPPDPTYDMKHRQTFLHFGKGRKLTDRTTIQMGTAIYISVNLGMIIGEASEFTDRTTIAFHFHNLLQGRLMNLDLYLTNCTRRPEM